MQENNYFQAIYKSFYSPHFYRDVKQNWGAGVVLYLLFILAICWAVALVPMQKRINIFADHWTAEMVRQAPEIKINKGIVSTPENRPYIIQYWGEKNEFGGKENEFAVIDTSGHSQIDQTAIRMLLTKDTLYTKSEAGVIKIIKIPENLTYDIVPMNERIRLEKITGWAWVVLFPLFLLVSFIYRLIQAVIFAVFGKFIGWIMRVPLSYANMLKLAIISLTPPIIIKTIFYLIHVRFDYESFFLFVVATIYLIFAIRANKI